jgi:hypothetical protein
VNISGTTWSGKLADACARGSVSRFTSHIMWASAVAEGHCSNYANGASNTSVPGPNFRMLDPATDPIFGKSAEIGPGIRLGHRMGINAIRGTGIRKEGDNYENWNQISPDPQRISCRRER